MKDIVHRIDSLNELIQDLLIFARPRPLQVEPFTLSDLLDQAAATFRKDPAASALTISVESDETIMAGDAKLLKAAFLNILLNAAQAMQGAGRISVRAASDGARCGIEIADSGPGIPKELLARVFEPFFTTKSRGGGLGLPIARRTIELHGGSITLTCPPDGGTSVRIDLPLKPPVTHTPETTDSAA